MLVENLNKFPLRIATRLDFPEDRIEQRRFDLQRRRFRTRQSEIVELESEKDLEHWIAEHQRLVPAPLRGKMSNRKVESSACASNALPAKPVHHACNEHSLQTSFLHPSHSACIG
jgi:hypothetical protein